MDACFDPVGGGVDCHSCLFRNEWEPRFSNLWCRDVTRGDCIYCVFHVSMWVVLVGLGLGGWKETNQPTVGRDFCCWCSLHVSQLFPCTKKQTFDGPTWFEIGTLDPMMIQLDRRSWESCWCCRSWHNLESNCIPCPCKEEKLDCSWTNTINWVVWLLFPYKISFNVRVRNNLALWCGTK